MDAPIDKAGVQHIAKHSLEMRLNNDTYQLFVIITNEFMQGIRVISNFEDTYRISFYGISSL